MLNAFQKTCKIEKEGVDILLKSEIGHKFSLSDDLSLQLKGIDGYFIHEGIAISIDIKVDKKMQETGNFFLEEWSNRKTKRKGWLETSEATAFCYFNRVGMFVYILDAEALRQFMQDGRSRYKLKEQREYQQENDTWGYIVPINHVVNDTYICKHVFDLHLTAANTDLI